MPAASAVRSPLSDAATRLRLGKRLARAGLTATERAVLGLRLRGLSHRQVAAAVSRSAARVEQLERQAVRKLTAVADAPRRVTVAAVLQSGRLGYLPERQEGRPLLVTTDEELHGDRRERRRARKADVPQSERRLEALATAMLAEAAKGALSEQRRGWYAEEAARLAG
jgi:DNA-binding CsgD family transcriptional regulator